MSQGQGSFQTNQKPAGGGKPGPPFLLTSANNGLSVDPITGKIVLGQDVGALGDPAALLSPRQIPLSTFSLEFTDPTGNIWFLLDQPGTQALIGPSVPNGYGFFLGQAFAGVHKASINSADTSTIGTISVQSDTGAVEMILLSIANGSASGSLTIDAFANQWVLNVSGVAPVNSAQISGSGINEVIEADIGGNAFLVLDRGNSLYQLGDIDAILHGSKLRIDDGGSTTTLTAKDPSNSAELLLIGAAGSELASLFTIVGGVTTIASIDGVNRQWRAFEDNGGNYIRMSGFNSRPIEAGIDNGAGTVLRFLLVDNDPAAQVAQFGDINGENLGNFIEVQYGLGSPHFAYKNQVTPTGFLNLNEANATYQMGDLDTTNNGNFLLIDDNVSEFQMTNALTNAAVRINGVLGFTGTVTPVTSITVNGGIVTNVT